MKIPELRSRILYTLSLLFVARVGAHIPLPGLDPKPLLQFFQDQTAGGGGTLVAVVAALALIALVAFFATHLGRPLVWLPTGLLVGGAAGNLIDRAREGAVTDFVDLPLWPAFNVADAAITIGVLALLYVLEGPPSRGSARRD